MPEMREQLERVGTDPTWDNCVPPSHLDLVKKLSVGDRPRPVQYQALSSGLLESRRNVIVVAPTNSGKSLIGTLVLIEALRLGKRALLIEPTRALAAEQANNLQRVLRSVSDFVGRVVSVKVTTGDYRLQAEEYSDPAPAAELIVCTPERLDAILRNPDNQPWIDSLGAVVLDEAHLIGNPQRGPTQEFLLTSLLLQRTPPRLVLLSATLGDLEGAKEWLAPCEVFQVSTRYPPLRKEVLGTVDGEQANEVVAEWLKSVLEKPDTQALVFVYRTQSTVSLAHELTKKLGSLAGSAGAHAYHSQMSVAQRENARAAFLDGRSRIIVTTSALAMGVNLPATHVVVRDLTYPGARSPDVADLLQMMGRAGRGDREGHSVVIKRPQDDWNQAELQQSLAEERIPEFVSAFSGNASARAGSLSPAIPLVATLLARSGTSGQSHEELERFLRHSFGGVHLAGQIAPSLQWLERKTLCFREDDRYRLTVLGERAIRSVLPLPLAAGLAQLLRDLMSVDSNDELLGEWQELDHLLVLHALYDRSPSLRLFSKSLAEQVTGWSQGNPAKSPVLFRRWIDGEKGFSKANEVLVSLGVASPSSTRDKVEWARRQGYLSTFHAIVLHERGHGRSIEQLTRQFKIDKPANTSKLEGIEERWRDDMLWLLAGVAKLLEIRTFYFHLREDCEAEAVRIKRVKRLLTRMRHQIYDLQEKLKYCSPLGPALRDMRRLTGGGVGVQTIRALEKGGVKDVRGLYELGTQGMTQLGVRGDIAKRIQYYLHRRMS